MMPPAPVQPAPPLPTPAPAPPRRAPQGPGSRAGPQVRDPNLMQTSMTLEMKPMDNQVAAGADLATVPALRPVGAAGKVNLFYPVPAQAKACGYPMINLKALSH